MSALRTPDTDHDHRVREKKEKDTHEDTTTLVPVNDTSDSDTDTVATLPLPRPQVPVLPHYTSLPIPSNHPNATTTTQHALFATHPIKRGTRLIHEPPLLTLPHPGTQTASLLPAFHALPPSSQSLIWSLPASPACTSPSLTALSSLIDPLITAIHPLTTKPPSQWTPSDHTLYATTAPTLIPAITAYRLTARWHTARFSLTDLPEHERAELPEGTQVTGLFPETARLRHSCVPNCFAAYDAVSNHMTVHATHDIPQGGELTLSALPDAYYTSATQRAASLAQKFGITCACEACTPSHPRFPAHEAAREVAHSHAVSLAAFFDNDAHATLDQLVQAENRILRLIRALREAGCEGPEVVRWRGALVERVQPGIAGMTGG
ncbi:hypothetical protein P153DRAFT_388910 [Dothidotthia symphoricarpi CBS 119687]|uniref:SET domain-containing protein n=1 Tax=Dothidotthia symphoricarpi CBS 119687 TaxID=1392245 RepID=A0A6A6A4W2_9PLEO|nr:uncharacterized protein P153DRAFT_388910 [Dothidotthia symphoricarpi CBS 119687]KAF2126164.1 hypothetical protein P153DRAFT_388910 [Dothidotthia symphoricarpi CBS 119687]